MVRPMLALIAFAPLDCFWVAVFIAVMFACCAIFCRLGKRSESKFFFPGRGLSWWLPATSIYAPHTATDTPVWITGVIYKHGMRSAWIPFVCIWCAVTTVGPTLVTYLLYRQFAAKVRE